MATTVPSKATREGRESSLRLLAVVALILSGTAWTVASFLASDAEVRAAEPTPPADQPPLFEPRLDPLRATSLHRGGAAQGALGAARADASVSAAPRHIGAATVSPKG